MEGASKLLRLTLDLGSLGAGSQGLPLILDADSGQVEAIEQALRGRSLVVRGAPGTGKTLLAIAAGLRLSING